jgi:hypothetical protein
MSLQQFIVDNRLELINQCKAKIPPSPSPQPSEVERGVAVFLSQLGTALREEEGRDPAQKVKSNSAATSDIIRSATLHGQSLSKLGFTIEQVVRGYGDVCQAVTALADQRSVKVTISEFHTLNLCVDNAIAGAVSSWSDERKSPAEGKGRKKLLDLVGTANVSFDALRTGRVGSGSNTAALLQHCLVEMRSLLDDPKWTTD